MKKYPKKENEMDGTPQKKKDEKGFNVTLYGFEGRLTAREHLKVINYKNDYNVTGVQFGIIKKENYHVVNAFVVGVNSQDEAYKVVLNYLTRKISRDYVGKINS